MGRLRIVFPAVALVAVAVGCGDKTIDSGKVEKGLEEQIKKNGQLGQLKSLDCPDDVKAKKGDTFECALTATDGSKATLVVTQQDDDGNVRVTSVKPN